MSKEAKILIAIAGAVLLGGILLAVFANPQPKDPGEAADPQALVRSNSHMTGNIDAKVTLVEFGDYQCPACAAAQPGFVQLKEEFADNPDVNFVYRHFPLDSIHPNARPAANAAEAAAEQGKFWEMNDLLYERQESWSTQPNPVDIFVSYAEELGLNTSEFRSNLENRIYTDIITADYNDGVANGVNSTPTFFLNGQKLPGLDVAAVRDQINQLLSTPEGEVSAGMAVPGADGVEEMIVENEESATEPQ